MTAGKALKLAQRSLSLLSAERLSEVTSKKLAPGQATAIVTGAVSIIIGVSQLLLMADRAEQVHAFRTLMVPADRIPGPDVLAGPKRRRHAAPATRGLWAMTMPAVRRPLAENVSDPQQ